MDNGEEVFAARHFAVVEARSLDRAGQFCRSTLDQNAVANISEQVSGAFVLHWPGVPGPDAVVTTVGLRVVKNTRKNNPPIPNIKRLLHIGSYAFSSTRRGDASVEQTACISGASGFS
jgi:hypothetical protein